MYQVSSAFHNACFARGARVRQLVRFSGVTFFTDEDIAQSNPLNLQELLNSEEDLQMGAAPGAEISFTALNRNGLLNEFPYGECAPYIGVRVSSTAWTRGNAFCTAIMNYGTGSAVRFDGYSTAPYLTVNGSAANVQPPFAVNALLLDGNDVYVISANGDVWLRTWDDTNKKLKDPSNSTWEVLTSDTWGELKGKTWGELSNGFKSSKFMEQKLKRWTGRGLAWRGRMLHEFTAKSVDTWEYCPLGIFTAGAPKRRVQKVSVTGMDRMEKFDADASNWWNSISWGGGFTLHTLLQRMCAQLEVTLKTSNTYPNANVLVKNPLNADGLTYRDILRYIAEAGCSYARFDRDGVLELAWFSPPTNAPEINANRYFTAETAEYNVPIITAVQMLSDSDDVGVTVGSGNNGYQIVDNPFLAFSNQTQGKTMAQAIYARLNGFAAYSPVIIKALCDPSIQAGDIITATVEGETRKIPVFTATITPTRATYGCTGNVARPVTSKEQRENWRAGRKYHDLTLDVDGLRSRIGNAEGDITSLELTAAGLKTRIENAEGDITSLEATADGLDVRITGTEGEITSLKATTNSLGVQISNAKGDITSLEATTNSLGVRVSNTEGDISSLELSLSGLQSQVSGKINGSTAQSMIDQSIDSISLSVSSRNGSSTFTLRAGQTELSTDTLNLTVNAVNVSGTLSASQIDATHLQVDGANIYNLTVTNADIENLSCSKLTGYMPAARLSDATHQLSELFVGDLQATEFSTTSVTAPIVYIGSKVGAVVATLNTMGIKYGGTQYTWDTIVSGGGGAVFG